MADRILSLAQPPNIRQLGISVHGQQPVQRWNNFAFWSLHAYHYRAVLYADGQRVQIEPGCVTVLMAGENLEYHFEGPARHVYAHFTPTVGTTDRRSIAIVRQMGDRFEQFEADFREAVGWFPYEKVRATARFWDLLWRIAGPAVEIPGTPTMPPALARAMEIIELSMAAGLSVASLADQVDLSPAHLNRLFRQHTHVGTLQYVLGRRIERATHLLKHTTLPIKTVAREVGIKDLQQFNKLMRHRTGQPPRAVRRNH
jgi:AraC-like DNA-binding protein